ncbi:MAG: type II toxin-antitoxin system RelE/ParE family toxin [Desulfovibrio sp.]|nr:MAG: type II toxin-antitoxin system RelE/ParE family toxin [Desulfovibrio sp.]
MPRFIRSRKARQDLVDIWRHIAEHDPDAADALLDSLDAKCALLATHPLLGPARDDIRSGLRYFPIREYVILYRVQETTIEIVRVLHAKRDLHELI